MNDYVLPPSGQNAKQHSSSTQIQHVRGSDDSKQHKKDLTDAL